ncbi:MAG: aminotransferase class III-fold pyridoxal phosphate-dependent enzyme, partial [Caldilineae bacterium]
MSHSTTPPFPPQAAVQAARRLYNLNVRTADPLPGEQDANFRLTTESGAVYILKIAPPTADEAVLDMENRALEHLAAHAPALPCPRLRRTRRGEGIVPLAAPTGAPRPARLFTALPGEPLAHRQPHPPALLEEIGYRLGQLDNALATFTHPAMRRPLQWDLQHAPQTIARHRPALADPARRELVDTFLHLYQTAAVPLLPYLRQSVIHNDGNDYNILVQNGANGQPVVSGLVDFGDMVYTHTVNEVAIAAAYAALDKSDPIAAAAHVVRGYHLARPLTAEEQSVLFPLLCMRLCVSVSISARRRREQPGNPYLTISEKPAWATLERLAAIPPAFAADAFRYACLMPSCRRPDAAPLSGASPLPELSPDEIVARRRRHIGPALSIAYRRPLKIVRGFMQYLFDETGRAYLDAVNNVPHVGHCHPRVVAAAQQQMARLNTNTRYLHDLLVHYAERLCATLPEPLRVCFFVCTGSEANELALRLARTHTGRRDVLVLEHAYHGNTSSLIELSPYKFDGPGGMGAPPHVHKTLLPDTYRGPYRADDPHAARQYARHAQDLLRRLEREGRGIAAFFAESLPGCAGQIVLPDGYLREMY